MPFHAFVLAAAVAGSAAATTPPAALHDPALVAGCYILTLGSWHPELELGRDKAFILPPTRVEFRTARGKNGWAEGHYVLVPVPGHTSLHSGMFWDLTQTGAVHVVFTTGYAGLTMDLSSAGPHLVGSAQTFWDTPRPKQTTTVTATREPCNGPSSPIP